MTREELIVKLRAVAEIHSSFAERNHEVADDLLIEFINDKEIEKVYNMIHKWYS